jgi:hypothetical protein
MMKVLTGSFSYSPVAGHYTVFKGKINESPVVRGVRGGKAGHAINHLLK